MNTPQNKPENPAAFPQTLAKGYREGFEGMTLRDYFAAKTLQGMFASDSEGWTIEFTKEGLETRTSQAYQMADAMLAERAKK